MSSNIYNFFFISLFHKGRSKTPTVPQHVKTIYENMSTSIEHESKQLKIRCLVQWYSQERQDVGHGGSWAPRRKYMGKNIY